ncbi:hypothetical protein PATSB16_33730 [Pandoraea thiooxydans]|uniref:Tim44-like domain-containing protein n=1 Tax=Pandoraea thiooxydans TaxID=445709 RepID=A0A0G3EPY3_9BURK|nr:hypothetical protein ABW99_13865 [Pandoraea thiooxydans]APR96709.1 hypothetical protein PATSB16_33730 [Pandoraea thiooxydans]
MLQFVRSKVLLGFVAGVLTLGLVANDAEARRMGGSRSIGKQSSTVTQRQLAPQSTQAPAQAQQPRSAATPAAAGAQTQPRNRWLGPLAGIAAGLGIAALLSHFGLAGAAAQMLANAIVIALIAFAVIWLIRRLRGSRPVEPAYAANGGYANGANTQPALREVSASPAVSPLPGGAGGLAAGQPWGVPADFDTDVFLRHAKVNFVRLQAAWDAGNMADIREFTTPEMYAEIKMDLDERAPGVNRTDVVKLDAELLGIDEAGAEHMASVRFSGLLRESEGAPAEPFNEVWNLTKPIAGGGGWLLAGIQQLN